jgi:hypothetical protein
MYSDISHQDLDQLASVSCEVVQQLDFPKAGALETKCHKMANLLGEMASRYENSELVFDAMAAVSSRPLRKMAVYTVARDILRQARQSSVEPYFGDMIHHLPAQPAPAYVS